MVEPRLQPMAPAVATRIKENLPVKTRYPANGMMISDGNGMHADSAAISKAMPSSPLAEITATIAPASHARRPPVNFFPARAGRNDQARSPLGRFASLPE